MEIKDILNRIYVLPERSLLRLCSIITESTFPKRHLVIRSDRAEDNIYFIKTGLARAYTSRQQEEITFFFGQPGDIILPMRSYVQNGTTYENVELLEQTTLFALSRKELQELYMQDLHIANWGRRLAEKELLATEERLISRQVRSATDRYKELMDNNPTLLQQVPLRHIASYLGITQVSLSRVRTKSAEFPARWTLAMPLFDALTWCAGNVYRFSPEIL